MDTTRISNIVSRALDSGQLSVKSAEGSFAISAGQVRLGNVAADSKDAELSMTGNLDLTDGSIDARLVLSGSSKAAGSRPDIFMALKGPVAAPSRSVDVSALTGWLTLRAVENQARKLRAIEAARPPAPPPVQPPPAPAPTQSTPTAPENKPSPGAAPIVAPEHPAAPQRQAAPPHQPAPQHQTVPKTKLAPRLPAPVDIRPAPAPTGVVPPPSVRSQN
jgi:large subunit ribosomal protein L24